MCLSSKLQQCITLSLVILTWMLGDVVLANCNAYVPAFPPPQLDLKSKVIQQVQQEIESILQEVLDEPGHKPTWFSAAVTSKTKTLFEFHHTPESRDHNRPGALTADGKTCYRIASCTKPFTVLAMLQLEKEGKLRLDDPVNRYVVELNGTQEGTLPWKDITLRSLASQMSGVPRDMGQEDILLDLEDPISHGFPPLHPSEHHEIQCDQMANYSKSCSRDDLLQRLKNAPPLFAPKQQSTYSNLNFNLLSLVLENVTSMPYVDLIQTEVLDKLEMTSTSFQRPDDSAAALPRDEYSYWDFEMGIQNASGGLYSSTDDLAKFMRHVLTSYNGISSAVNWIQPTSYSTGLNSFYGMPWEIFRTTEIIPYSNRPVTFVTKGGGVPGYISHLAAIPDYDFAYVILTAGGNSDIFDVANEAIALKMTEAAEYLAQVELKSKYTGSWSTTASPRRHLNSSIEFAHSLERGLWVSRWISNGTDILDELGPLVFPGVTAAAGRNQYLQLVPTLLFKDAKNQKGEIWRLLGHQVPKRRNRVTGQRSVFRDFCVTDLDEEAYAGIPQNEVVFWDQADDGTFGSVELSGFRIRLQRSGGEQEEQGEGEQLVLQT